MLNLARIAAQFTELMLAILLAPLLTGWTVIEAPDADAAARLVQNHPFISLSGGMVQIWEPDDLF